MRELWNEVGEAMNADGVAGADEQTARQILTRFVKNTEAGVLNDFDTRRHVSQMIANVLAVNLDKPSKDRRGAVPAALGLVSRVSWYNRRRDRLVFLTIDRLMTAERLSLTDAVQRTVAAASQSRLVYGLDEPGAVKIYQRWRDSGPIGPTLIQKEKMPAKTRRATKRRTK